MTDDTHDGTARIETDDGEAETALIERVETLTAENERLRAQLREEHDRLRDRLDALATLLSGITGRTRLPGVDGAGRQETGDGTLLFDGASATYRVLGQFDESSEGIGVLGCNIAGSGTTYGVKGEVADQDGYGLATPDDVKIDGALDGELTGNTPIDDLFGTNVRRNGATLEAAPPPLPELTKFWSSNAVNRALAGVFGTPGWADPVYADGASYDGDGQSFRGAVRVHGGEVVVVPHNADTVGVYDQQAGTFTAVDGHSQGSGAFWGGVLAPTGEVIFAPHDAANVGRYDPLTETYSDGDSHGTTSNAYAGAVVAKTGDVIFVPYDAESVGVYDPVNDTFSTGASISSNTGKFRGGTLTNEGNVLFAPFEFDSIVIYDPDNDTVVNTTLHGKGGAAFDGATLLPDGRVVLAPFGSDAAAIYDVGADSLDTSLTHGETTPAFSGSALAPTGEVILVPASSAHVGIVDPETDSYVQGPSHGRSTPAFNGAALTPYGDVVLPPRGSASVGLVAGTTGIETHPLLNNS